MSSAFFKLAALFIGTQLCNYHLFEFSLSLAFVITMDPRSTNSFLSRSKLTKTRKTETNEAVTLSCL